VVRQGPPTADVDVLEILPQAAAVRMASIASRGGPLFRKYGIYLEQGSVAHLPENYERRLAEMFPGAFQRLRVMALDRYDLALSKLARNSGRDREDVWYLARTVPFDLDVLRDRYQAELRWQVAVPEREDLTLKLWTDVIQEQRRGR